MSDRSLTLLELHFHSDGDVQVGPSAIGGLTTEGTGEPVPDGGETGGRRVPFALVGVLGLGVAGLAAVALRRLLAAE